MQFAKFVVAGVVPNIEHRRIHHVPEDFFAAVVQTAQGDIAIDQDRHRAPEPVAGFANALLLGIAQGSAPIVDVGKVDVIDYAIEHLFGLLAIGGLTRRSDDDRCFHLGLVPQLAERFDVLDHLGVIQTDTKGVELFGIRPIDADLDLVESAMQDPLGDITPKQIPVGENLHTRDPLVLAILDPICQLLVDQRLAVPVQMDQPSPPLDTLLDNRLEDLLLHVGFGSTDGRSRAKHTVSLAMVGRFDTNRFWKRLTQQRHRIGDDIRGDRANCPYK